MGNPAALVAGPGLSPMGIAATVSTAPANADDTLDLHWLSPRDGEDGEESVRERDLRWVSTSRLPAVGDDALLFVDSLGDPWAFVWATGAVMGDTSASLAALDSRLDALEAPPRKQIGSGTTAAIPAGNNVLLVTLPVTWPTQHLAFFLELQPTVAAFTVTSHYSGPNSTSGGFAHVVTSGVTQAFNYQWVSWGS